MRGHVFFWSSVTGLALLAAIGLSGGGATAWSGAQEESASRLSFEVIESFDAKYLGDTPGHMGRVGGLAARRPRVALGDPVYRGEEIVGTVTGLVWNRANGSLDIEFDPAALKTIVLGDTVWIALREEGDMTRPTKSVNRP